MNSSDLRLILEKAILAPSADNLQPWKFKTSDNKIDIFLNSKYTQNFCDEGLLIPYLSAGAAIENMRVTGAQLGYELFSGYLPNPNDPLLVATVTFVETMPKSDVHFQSLEKRATNRKFYSLNQQVNSDVYLHLIQLVEREGFKLLWLKKDDSGYKELSRILGQADQLRYEIKRLHKELVETLRFNPAETNDSRDGLNLKTFETGPGGEILFKLIRPWNRLNLLNAFGLSWLFNFYTRLQMFSSQAAGLLVAQNNQPADFIRKSH